MDYVETYKNGVSNGLSVVDAKENFYGTKSESTSFIVSTPYTFQGRDVYGYCEVYSKVNGRVSFDETERFKNTHQKELYVLDMKEASAKNASINEYSRFARNLEDLRAEGVYDNLRDGNGNIVTDDTLLFDMSSFASAASQYPHAYTFDEFKAAQNVKAEQFKNQPEIAKAMQATPDDYYNYLNNVGKEFDSNIEYIGKTTKRSEMDRLYSTVIESQNREFESMQYGN